MDGIYSPSDRLFPEFTYRDADTLVQRVRDALTEYKSEIETLKSISDEEVTFANTIEALESSGRHLEVTEAVFFNLLSCDADDRMMELSEGLMEELTDVSNEVNMDLTIANKVKKIYDQPQDDLSDIQRRLLLRTYESYRDRGTFLDETVRRELKELRKKLSLATLRFGQNVLKEQNAYRLSVLDAEALQRLPESALTVASQKAAEDGVQGWIFDMSAPSYMALMQYCDSRAIREKIYRDRGALGFDATKSTSNIMLVREIVELRRRIAALLGYETYADMILSKRMAKDTKSVYAMLDQLRDAYMPLAQREVAEIQRIAYEHDAIEQIMPWDWSYYAELYRQEVLSFDEEQTRPYFELQSVLSSMFELASDLYGISFIENHDLQPYRDDVQVFDVMEGSALVGTLLTDFHPRKGKRSGAWMTNYIEAYADVRPVVSLVMNFTPPTSDKPSLLTLGEARTLFHEFGHGLHGLLTRVPYSSLSGTNVLRDFVELPSQIMENWLLEPQFLRKIARHYETGAEIPPDMLMSIERNNLFLEGYACIRQLGFGYLDMAWHSWDPEQIPADITELERAVNDPIRLLPHVDGTATSTSFSHIFSGGYAVGYYGYKWAEILDADAFEEFRQAGLRDKATATRFRTQILERGDAEDPDVLYRNFKGADPTVDALLRRSGL